MTVYSNSRISTFEQCKYKYKLSYIDYIKSHVRSVEAFMGSLIHDALEKLYFNQRTGKLISKDEFLEYYLYSWNKLWKDDILIVKKEYNQEYYKNLGLKLMMEYYDKYHPFEQLKTIDLETDEKLELAEGNKYYVKIDRLAMDDDGNYYVIDYKTGKTAMSQTEVDNDRQLAMYSIWVKNSFPKAKSIKLVWNFLTPGVEKYSIRSDGNLEKVKLDVENKIKEIESCEDFPTTRSRLCDYCGYKSICPEWKVEEINGGRDLSNCAKQSRLGDFFN